MGHPFRVVTLNHISLREMPEKPSLPLNHATVDWRTISFGSTKEVRGGSSGSVDNVSTRRAAASPMRSMDWSTEVSGTFKYCA
jgi:hypothetical protein